MPETSQDAFETKFPGNVKQPVTPEELRNRSNSLNKKSTLLDNTLIAAESNFWPLSTNTLGLPRGSRGQREPKISVGDVDGIDSCYTVPEPYGYKRESSHR